MDLFEDNSIIDLDSSSEFSCLVDNRLNAKESDNWDLLNHTKRTLVISGDRQHIRRYLNEPSQSVLNTFEKIDSLLELSKAKIGAIELLYKNLACSSKIENKISPVFVPKVAKPKYILFEERESHNLYNLIIKNIHSHFYPEPVYCNRIKRGRPEHK